jgi:transposase
LVAGAEGADTQRAPAERLGVSEPSVSRMVRVLADGGWLQTFPDPAGGNRNRLRLTATGEQLVQRWGAELEERLAALLETAGVPYRTYRPTRSGYSPRSTANRATPGRASPRPHRRVPHTRGRHDHDPDQS